MANIFHTRTKDFLNSFFKNSANAEGDVIKAINDGNTLYNDLINKYTAGSDISNHDLVPILNKVKELKRIQHRYENIVNAGIRQISTINKIITIINTIVKLAKIIITIITSLPIPTTYSTIGIVTMFSQKAQQADRKIESLANTISSIQPFLSKLLQVLNAIRSQLSTLDGVIGKIEAFLATKNKDFKSSIDSRMTSLASNQQILLGLPETNTNIIGFYQNYRFELREENNPNAQVQGIKRNYAVAINQDTNREELKSSFSFASQPSVLVDELKFAIDNRNQS